MGCSDIKLLSASVLDSLATFSYSQYRMHDFRLALSAITTWFTENENGVFSRDAAAQYEAFVKKQVADGIHKKKWRDTRLRCLDQLRSFYSSGNIGHNFDRCSRIEYVPSAESVAIVNEILKLRKAKDRTKMNWASYLRRFFCEIERRGITFDKITLEVLAEYILSESARIPDSRVSISIAMTMLCEYLLANSIINKMPDFKFLVPRERTRKILPAFSVDEVAAILNSIDQSTAIGKRNYAIIFLAVTTGMRAGDILNLKFGDVDFENYKLHIIQQSVP